MITLLLRSELTHPDICETTVISVDLIKKLEHEFI